MNLCFLSLKEVYTFTYTKPKLHFDFTEVKCLQKFTKEGRKLLSKKMKRKKTCITCQTRIAQPQRSFEAEGTEAKVDSL